MCLHRRFFSGSVGARLWVILLPLSPDGLTGLRCLIGCLFSPPTCPNNRQPTWQPIALLAPQQERLLWLIDMMEVGKLLKFISALQHVHIHTRAHTYTCKRTKSTPCFVTCSDCVSAVSFPLFCLVSY